MKTAEKPVKNELEGISPAVIAQITASVMKALAAETSKPATKPVHKARGGAGAGSGGPGKPYVSQVASVGAGATGGGGGGAAASAPTTTTTTTKKSQSVELTAEQQSNLDAAMAVVDLGSASTFTGLNELKINENTVRLFYCKKFVDKIHKTTKIDCMAVEVHSDAINYFKTSLKIPPTAVIQALMKKVYDWVKENNATILQDIKDNDSWKRCFPEDRLDTADVVFMKGTKALVGTKKSAAPFDDDDA